jgi:hypothetical protein
MSIIAPPTNTRIPPDDLDALLRDYFRSEMPDRFPALRLPAPTRRTLPRPQTFSARSRSLLALAAAVLFLIGGSWYLSGTPTEFATPSAGVGQGKMGNAKTFLKTLQGTKPGAPHGTLAPAGR